MEGPGLIEPMRPRELVGFEQQGANWVLIDPMPVRYVLKETAGYYYLMDPVAERIYIFEKTAGGGGRIAIYQDRNDNRWTYLYSGTSRRPYRVEDGLGRFLEFTYSGNLLTQVTDHCGRRITYTMDADSIDAVTDAAGQTTTFTYDNTLGPVTQVRRPAGNVPYTQAYASRNLNGTSMVRVTSQRDAYGNATALAYAAATNRVTETRPDGTTVIYQHHSNDGPPKSLTDAAGNTANFSQTPQGQTSEVTDRLGGHTMFGYHTQSGKLATITNAKGDVLNYTYTPQDQTITNPFNGEAVTFTFYDLTQANYPDGTHESYAYDTRGNLTTYTDLAGQVWTYEYNSRGQPTRVTNPTGGVSQYTYNADGTLATSSDSDMGVITNGYDACKRLTQVTLPTGAQKQIAYNPNDQVTSITDERGKTTTFAYDANGNRVTITDPSGQTTTYTYDLMDRMTRWTNKLGKATNYAYDAMNHLASVTDPNGNATQWGYDSRGWQTRRTDPAGKVWQTDYNTEGVPISMTTPLSHCTSFDRDALGYITAITDPLGNRTTFTRDKMGRITASTDPLGRTTTYAYDNRGLLTSVTLPDTSSATYTYNPLGSLSTVTDLRGQAWNFTYTAMGRLASQTDPLGNQWQYTYNQRGLLERITYPDGRTQTLTYDAAGNLTRQQYTNGPDLQFTYDDLNRMLTANGIGLAYNAMGQVTNTQNAPISFGATYDDGGRLKTVSYADGLFTVTYTYDARNLLTQVSDNLTNASVQFTYDDDGRLIGMQRSNGVNATLTWDAASRLTRTQDGSVLDIQTTYDVAGQIAQQQMTAPLDPVGALVGATDTFTYDAASQVNSSGYTYDARGRLIASPGYTYTWDDASRLVGVNGVILTYNGLNNLMTRIEGGQTIRYYYNHALSLAPIVAERNDGTAQFLRYYVWTPSGKLLYMINAADANEVYFYHFDQRGSTLTLTNQSGTVTDSYVYTPYGKLLQHQGSNPQPFTFGGQSGVRQEGNSGTLYHMRARYYDATTTRFLSREPVWSVQGEPQQINPYQYALNAPIGIVDVTGREPQQPVDENKLSLAELTKHRML
jgi:RHS repeat-associated protein